MAFPGRWSRHPQSIWVRRALFQVHLWAGLGAGLYILLISLSGSAIVFRNELHQAFTPEPMFFSGPGVRLTEGQLKEASTRQHPGLHVSQIWMSESNPDRAVEIWLAAGGDDHIEILINPYTGADLGRAVPRSIRILDWLVNFHDNLLYAETGRMVNGIGALLLVLLCLTGLIIWWPGLQSWRGSIGVDIRTNWKRLNWSLHSAVGFWSLVLVFMWAISGVYLVFPDPFTAVVDHLDPLAPVAPADTLEFQPQGIRSNELPEERMGDAVLRWLARLHFGRSFGWPVKVLWTVLGSIPPILFFTGAIMWWNRVVRPGSRLKTSPKP